ncbi:MAG: 23S rRNA (uracil(1939)-C(5))-methyltransferase RlmD [Clostridiales bacterium]|jgi:23S rRNA (uracil1939-C5)-methyltransferase|nr:23S rRNA (uracil(1939)-C(5))-methyltransferase RlmD [Clostridiales bacterium]
MEIKKNAVYEVAVTDLSSECSGVGKVDGFTVFCPGMLPGETGSVKIIKLSTNYAIGKCLEIHEKSPHKREPFCEVFNSCGGCSLANMEYSATLQYKQKRVTDCIERIGKIKDLPVKDITGMEEPFKYRNKAIYQVGCEQDRLVSGFYAKGSHRVVPVNSCAIQAESADRIRLLVVEFLNSQKIAVYDEITKTGLVRAVMLRTSFYTGQNMLVIVINGKSIPCKKELIEFVRSIPDVKSLYLNINTDDTNVVLGETFIHIWGETKLPDKLGKLNFYLSPQSFLQVNPVQTVKLYDTVCDFLGVSGDDVLVDLYCGVGTIGLYCAGSVKKVFGVEIVPQAVRDARQNAVLNNVSNAEFIQGDAASGFNDVLERGFVPTTVVLDPPRKGCDSGLLELVVNSAVQKVIYVSCDPATLARDLKAFVTAGFLLENVQPIDMFPWTAHVETIVSLQRRNT